ncbi:hypothetical protein GJ496_005884 [Pomphorhynchus laevis]|nr:hypothetical protein GJ496_005884 [Pomphorhynchus laevis]
MWENADSQQAEYFDAKRHISFTLAPMCSRMYLEKYLESLNDLPGDMKNGFNSIKKMDIQCNALLEQIQKLENSATIGSETPSNVDDIEKQIKIHFDKLAELGEKKVNKANKIYELVDKHIQRLDVDLAKFEAEIKENVDASKSPNVSKPSTQRKRKHRSSSLKELPISSLALTLTEPNQVLDMPIDPNEPTYCICSQVSYGEMIGCDNPECPIEWFHFACVGLKEKPKGDWFCPKCSKRKGK